MSRPIQNSCKEDGSAYISLWSALNIEDGSGNSGDWHSLQLLPKNLQYAGADFEVNTLPWLGKKGIITYPDYESLPEGKCKTRWRNFPGPYSIANHKRAAVDLLYDDFIVARITKGLTVDMYAWIDKGEDIQEIMDDFQTIIDDLNNTPLAVNSQYWNEYKTMIWEMAA